MEKIDYIQKYAKRMIDENKGLVSKWREIEQMWRNEWDLPKGLKDYTWVYKAIDSSPSDALETAIRSFSANHPKPKLSPLGDDPDDKSLANQIERVLSWQFALADKRSETRLTPDGMGSALRYDKVCIQITHLPNHYDSIKAAYEQIENNTIRTERLDALEKRRVVALRKGDFIVHVRNPVGVYHRHSDLGLEAVLLVQKMRAADIVALWEHLASFLKTDKVDWEDEEFTYYDFQNLDQRAVWVSSEASSVESKDVILNVQNEVPFISWAIRTGGSALDAKPENRCAPYLNNVYTSKSWQLANTLKTASVSEVIKYSGAPRLVSQTPTGEGVEVEYGGDQAQIPTRPGETVTPFPPPTIDRAVLETYDREAAAMDAQTRVRVLMNPNFPGGTAFATINALMQSALDGLQPWRELAEIAFADMFELMLLWVAYTERSLIAYGDNKKDMGKQYSIAYDSERKDFDPNHIYLTVELSGDVPTDRVERINSAVMMYERLKVSLESVLEELGISDPQGVMGQRIFEDLLEAEVARLQQQKDAMSQMQLQQLMGAMQQMGQQPQGNPYQEAAPQQPMMEQMQGDGFNTAMGGTPTQVAMPGMGREQLAGDQQGNPLAV